MRDKKQYNMIWIPAVFMLVLYSYPAYGACTNGWEEPNPNYDPSNPYNSDPECITKPTEPCQVTGKPSTGQDNYTRTPRRIGPIEELDPSLGPYGYSRYSGEEIHETVDQYLLGDGPHTLYGDCELPLMDSYIIKQHTVPITISLSASIPSKFIEIGASLSHTWNFTFGGEPYQLYMNREDCTHHCASRWIIKKKACASMKGSYMMEAYLGPANLLYTSPYDAGPSVKCTDEEDHRVEWVTSSSFCVP